jgi:hypothetical protein
MDFISTKELNKIQKCQIMAMWNKEYPLVIKLNSLEDFDKYLSSLIDQKHILIISDDKVVKGWYIDFIRDDERWFTLILDSEIQGKGYGRKLLSMGKEINSELNGWVIDSSNYRKENGEMYKSPTGFYEKNGFQILFDVKFKTEKLTTIKINWKR